MILYKYCSVQEAINIISSGNIDLKIPRYFNDPYDCLYDNFRIEFGYKEIKSLIDKIPEKFKPQESELQDAILKNNNIFDISYFYSMSCFSETKENILMWSHYARNHSGVCLEFRFEDELLKNIKPITYVDKKYNLEKTTPDKAILLKYEDWRYEKEWRYVRPNSRSAIRWSLRAVNNLVKSKLSANDLSEWEEIKKNIWADFLKDETNAISIKPTAIYLGCEFANHGKMGENLEYDKSVPAYNSEGNLEKGITAITKYKCADLLELLIENKIITHLMQKDQFRFRVKPIAMDQDNLSRLINDIKEVNLITYESRDILGL